MRRTALALLAAVTLALAGCSSGGGTDPGPTATATVTATPSVDAAAARAACVEAWATLLAGDAGSQATPAPCAGVPEDEQLDAYMDGLQQRNKAGRESLGDCLADASCTALPVP